MWAKPGRPFMGSLTRWYPKCFFFNVLCKFNVTANLRLPSAAICGLPVSKNRYAFWKSFSFERIVNHEWKDYFQKSSLIYNRSNVTCKGLKVFCWICKTNFFYVPVSHNLRLPIRREIPDATNGQILTVPVPNS